ncbi:MAG TPA: ElyC/SanA/YdcF family protein [Polyangia bacterium]|nr:ElyC/SanA/YdcF family protein [Polyangia bacterium]
MLPLLLLSSLLHACAAGEDPEIDGPVPAAGLTSGPLWAPNERAIALFLKERAAQPDRDLWLALVPGTSEQWGHHKAPPAEAEAVGARVSDEFRARLDDAWSLLEAGAVRFILVSGGAVDPEQPRYVESERGREYLLATYAARWPEGDLADRVLVDPLALHSTTNVRNADKLSVDLGLNRSLVVTTMPTGSPLSAADYATQGFYFLFHKVSAFDARCQDELGYALGEFSLYQGPSRGGTSVVAIRHHRLRVDRLRQDLYGP